MEVFKAANENTKINAKRSTTKHNLLFCAIRWARIANQKHLCWLAHQNEVFCVRSGPKNKQKHTMNEVLCHGSLAFNSFLSVKLPSEDQVF